MLKFGDGADEIVAAVLDDNPRVVLLKQFPDTTFDVQANGHNATGHRFQQGDR
jgi:hypothetical protein